MDRLEGVQRVSDDFLRARERDHKTVGPCLALFTKKP